MQRRIDHNRVEARVESLESETTSRLVLWGLIVAYAGLLISWVNAL